MAVNYTINANLDPERTNVHVYEYMELVARGFANPGFSGKAPNGGGEGNDLFPEVSFIFPHPPQNAKFLLVSDDQNLTVGGLPSAITAEADGIANFVFGTVGPYGPAQTGTLQLGWKPGTGRTGRVLNPPLSPPPPPPS